MAGRPSRSRGHIETLPSGSFRARVYAGIDPLTGKRRYLVETAPNQKAAGRALTKLQRQVDEDRQPKTAITVRRAIAQWLEVVELEATTRERYDDLIRLYILPTLGDMLASKIDAELLERFYARLHRCRELCTGRPRAGHACRPLSTSTTRKIHYIIRGALERAVRWQHLGVNKAAMAVAPSPNRTEPDPPSAEEAAALLNDAWADPEWGLLLWLTMITGSRRGEVSALRWRHVDFDRASLWIHRSNAQTKAGIKEKETKTGQRRKVALDPHTLGLLEQHRKLWEQRCAALGCAFDPDAFVFSPAADGSTPYAPRAISQRYRRMAIKLKLRSTRIHSLRHYSATELIAAGVDLRTVAGRLGHGSGGATTLKVYAAWVDEVDRRAATTMVGIMPRPIAAGAVTGISTAGVAVADMAYGSRVLWITAVNRVASRIGHRSPGPLAQLAGTPASSARSIIAPCRYAPAARTLRVVSSRLLACPASPLRITKPSASEKGNRPLPRRARFIYAVIDLVTTFSALSIHHCSGGGDAAQRRRSLKLSVDHGYGLVRMLYEPRRGHRSLTSENGT